MLNNGDEVMSSSRQHTLAIVSCDEKYFTIKERLSSIFTDINNFLEQKNLELAAFIPITVNKNFKSPSKNSSR
jgi:Holliday junction resolvasome RuvABC endonuclease subunit